MFERITKLIGEDNVHKLQHTSVAIVGLGGVGGYAVESLARSGIGHLILVDYDKIDITNLNRQIISNVYNVACPKTDEWEKRILSINPQCKVEKLTLKLTPENIIELFNYSFDYLIDACDTISVKQELIKKCLERNIHFISSMGTGNKLDPSQLEVTDITKTSYDPIAKKIRKYLKENHIHGRVPVVYSKEQNSKFQGSIPSMVFVPATSGLLCANYIVKNVINLH
jgi:tRNA A37 threonylcarbamoyladenosine dehydratase